MILEITRPQFSVAPVLHALVLTTVILLSTGCASTLAPKTTETPAVSQESHQQHLKDIATIQAFSLKGRIGVQTEGRGFSGSMDWQHNGPDDDIALYSPIGGQVASIRKDANSVTLKDTSGNAITAKDAESLTQMTLGWQLPLTGLADWSLGRPTNNPIDKVTWNTAGQITRLVQDGWDIEYSDYVTFEGKQLPNKIYLRSPKVNIKLLVENRYSASLD